MIAALSNFFTKLASKYLPDAYVFALLLTILVFTLSVISGNTLMDTINFWGDGLWNLMTFSMQMSLILITGFTLAKTKPILAFLNYIANFASGQKSAVLLVTIVSSVSCILNWGFGLIVSGLFTIVVARKIKKINFGLLLASAYSGFLLWHGGLSGSIPLKLTSPSKGIQDIIGKMNIGMDETIYSSMNILLLVVTFLTIIIVNLLMACDESNLTQINFKEELEQSSSQSNTFSQKIENSYLLNFLIVLIGLIYICNHFLAGKNLSLNITIFIFLILAMAFNGNSKRFLENFNNSVKDSSGIILQFPFYAGLMGIMSSSGLATLMSEFFVSISNEKTFLFFTYISAGVVNFFVPSGGGQWVVQAPIILPAAKVLGVDFAKVSMAIAWGDAWSNMVQPFWALPLLSLSGLSLKDMMGYSVIIFIASGITTSLVFLFFV